MSMEISNAIIVFLTTIILILLFVVIKLNIQFYNEKKNFKKKVEVLGRIIVQISKDKSGKLNQIKLSEELESKLKTIYNSLASDIFELNKELFEILSKNDLTKD